MNEHALSECSTRAEAALDGLGVRWALIGALAAIRYRVDTRATTDVDYLVERHDHLASVLGDAGFDVTVQRDDAGSPYFVRARLGGAVAEFLIAETEYQETALDRAIDHVITPEDVVVHKLIAWRERDRDDIRSLLANPGLDLDTGYIDDWAARWEVTERWRSIRDG